MSKTDEIEFSDMNEDSKVAEETAEVLEEIVEEPAQPEQPEENKVTNNISTRPSDKKKLKEEAKEKKAAKKSKDSTTESKGIKIAGKTISTPMLIGGIAALLVLVLIVASIFKKPNEDYFSVLSAAINSDGGTVKYVITVNSAPYDGDKEQANISYKDLNNLSAADLSSILSSDDTSDGKHSGSFSTSWSNSTNTEITEWQYPNYVITITGQTYKIDPYEAYYTVELKTQYINSTLLDIYAKDGYYYLDLSSLYSTLNDSKDAYLVNLASTIRNNKGIVKIKAEDFKFSTPFSDERLTVDLYKSKENLTAFITMMLNELRNTATGTVGKDGQYSFECNNIDAVINRITTLVSNTGSVANSYIDNVKGNMTEEELNRANGSIDNVVNAFLPVFKYFQTNDIKLALGGVSNHYTSGAGFETYESYLSSALLASERVYNIGLSVSRNTADLVVNVEKFNSSNEIKDTAVLDRLFKSIIDYFNPTIVNLHNNDTTNSFDNLEHQIRHNFINMVNDTGLITINESTLDWFILNYVKYDDKNNTLQNLVTTYVNMFNFDKKDVITNENDSDFLYITIPDVNTKAVISYVNTGNTRYSQFKLVLEDTAKTVDLTKFNFRDATGNKYPANNKTLLTGIITNSFKEHTDLETSYDLYFLNTELESADLYYGEEKLGTIRIK